jgi:pimeloyl-ACP methyl ester carboxylesterase
VLAAAAALTCRSAETLRAQWASDAWLENPVGEETFQTYLEFFRYDAGLPFDLEMRSVDDEEGIRVRHLAFTSTPDQTVYADYYEAATAAPDRPHLVLVHGGLRPGKASMKPMAEFLVRRGFSVMAIDMPLFGERDNGQLGSFSESDKHENLYNRESIYLQWVVQLVKDVGRTFDVLVDELGVDPERIAYVGFSRGAQAGFIVAAADERFVASAHLYGGHLDRSETGHLAAACPANYIGRISPRPMWVLNGTFDGDYDRERSVEPLLRHAGSPSEVHWVETGHQFPREQDLEKLADWLIEVVD